MTLKLAISDPLIVMIQTLRSNGTGNSGFILNRIFSLFNYNALIAGMECCRPGMMFIIYVGYNCPPLIMSCYGGELVDWSIGHRFEFNERIMGYMNHEMHKHTSIGKSSLGSKTETLCKTI